MLILTIAGFWQGLLATIFVILCLFLSLIILIQKPRGGGLSGAFGGAGGGGQMFGGKSGDILTWITVGFFVAFLVVGMLLVKATRTIARAPESPPAVTPAKESESPITLPEAEKPVSEPVRDEGKPAAEPAASPAPAEKQAEPAPATAPTDPPK